MNIDWKYPIKLFKCCLSSMRYTKNKQFLSSSNTKKLTIWPLAYTDETICKSNCKKEMGKIEDKRKHCISRKCICFPQIGVLNTKMFGFFLNTYIYFRACQCVYKNWVSMSLCICIIEYFVLLGTYKYTSTYEIPTHTTSKHT